MKRLFLSCLLVINVAYTQEKNNALVVQLHNQQQEKMKLLLGLIDFSESSQDLVAIVQQDLACSDQKLSGFAVSVRNFKKVPSKAALKNLAQEGYIIAVFLQQKAKDSLEWRIYDTVQAQMQQGKRIQITQNSLQAVAHALSDTLWKSLTGQEGIFSSRLAYCIEKSTDNHKGSDIYVQSPYDRDARCLVQGGKLIAPRWNKDIKNPLLLYSEITPTNVRLMAVTLDGKRFIVSNFEGLTMLPSFSSDGQRVVYCATENGSSQIFCSSIDPKRRRIVSEQITHNKGNNTSPTLRDNGDIVFCSDFESRVPHLYYYHKDCALIERLTDSGYCACPSFCEKNKKIVFCKLVGHTTQIFEYDLLTKQQKQITASPGKKDECCWSAEGTHIAYSVELGKTKRIALFNTITKEELFVTNEKMRCGYPCWSSSLYV